MQSPETTTRPTGTVTFLFTDIVGSTRLWDRDPSAMRDALAVHDSIVLQVASAHEGYAFNHAGDSWGIAFSDPRQAVRAAIELRRDLAATEWNGFQPIVVRSAIDTGIVDETDGDYLGPPLNRASRALAHAQGGEIVMTSATAGIVRHSLDPDARLIDLGEFKLRGMRGWEHLYRLEYGTSRRTGWRFRLQHGAWAVAVLATVAALWMAVDRSEPPTEQPTTAVAPSAQPVSPTDSEAPASERTVIWATTMTYGEPLATGQRVLAAARSGYLHALDLSTGNRLWSSQLPGEPSSRPVAKGGNVYLVAGQAAPKLVGYVESDGSLIFSCSLNSSPSTGPAIGSNRVFVVAADTPEVLAFSGTPSGPRCSRIDSISTAIRAFGAVPHDPVIYERTLLVVDNDGVLHAFDAENLAGNAMWSFDVIDQSGTDTETYPEISVSTPTVFGYTPPSREGEQPTQPIVLVAEKRERPPDVSWRLLFVDLHAGHRLVPPLTVGGPAGAGFGRIWVASPNGDRLDVLDHTGTLEQSLPIRMSTLPPLIDETTNRVYVVSPDDTITAINGVSLRIEWEFSFSRPVQRLTASRNVLIVQDEASVLTAIEERLPED